MSLLKAILKSDYLGVVECIDNGDDINAVLNGNTPLSILDIAIQARDENPNDSQAKSIVILLSAKGAKTYTKLLEQKPVKKNIPVSVKKNNKNKSIKTNGIATGRRVKVNLSRRNNRSQKTR